MINCLCVSQYEGCVRYTSAGGILVGTPGAQGGQLSSNYARMYVSKSEGHGYFFIFKGVK